jgi:cytochrome oxidase Cu insertion factor (SCO1/SenC/PrrC family)
MSAPSNMLGGGAPRRMRPSSWQLLAMMAVVFVPGMAAWVLYWNPQLLPAERANHGTLLYPPRPLPETIAWRRLDGGRALGAEDLRGKWTLVTLARGACTSACVNNLYIMRQARLALGSGMQRVRRLLLVVDPALHDELARALVPYPGTMVAIGAEAEFAEFLATLAEAHAEPYDHVFIVDPRGNVMMRYAPGFDGVGLVTDLERLLKVSQIG